MLLSYIYVMKANFSSAENSLLKGNICALCNTVRLCNRLQFKKVICH